MGRIPSPWPLYVARSQRRRRANALLPSYLVVPTTHGSSAPPRLARADSSCNRPFVCTSHSSLRPSVIQLRPPTHSPDALPPPPRTRHAVNQEEQRALSCRPSTSVVSNGTPRFCPGQAIPPNRSFGSAVSCAQNSLFARSAVRRLHQTWHSLSVARCCSKVRHLLKYLFATLAHLCARNRTAVLLPRNRFKPVKPKSHVYRRS